MFKILFVHIGTKLRKRLLKTNIVLPVGNHMIKNYNGNLFKRQTFFDIN